MIAKRGFFLLKAAAPFSVFLFCLALVPPSAADPLDPSQLERLRNQVEYNQEQAAIRRANAGEARERTARYRDLRDAALAEQDRLEDSDPGEAAYWAERAARYQREIDDLETYIKRQETQAEDYEADYRRTRQALDDALAEIEAAEAARRTSTTRRAATQAEIDAWAATDYRLPLDQAIGVWEFEEIENFFTIVPEDPGAAAYATVLEGHTPGRVWTGRYSSFPAGDARYRETPRMVFTYTPVAEEMDAGVPAWARQAVERKLEWRLELKETGTAVDPRLVATWYPGEIEWTEHPDGRREAEVAGDGAPRIFTLAPRPQIAIDTAPKPVLFLRFPDSHDPLAKPVEALMKHQRFHIGVTLPASVAQEAGSTVTVTVTGLKNGEETSVTLYGPEPDGTVPVTYSTGEAVTIADSDSYAETEREPQVMSFNWLMSVPGARLDLDVEHRERVRFTFAGSEVTVPVYDTWVQRALDQHQQDATLHRTILGAMIRSADFTAAQKAAAHDRLRMLSNYQELFQSDVLTDMHRFNLGELYLGGGQTTLGLVYWSDEEMADRLQQIRQSGFEAALTPHPDYFNPLMEAFIEGLAGVEGRGNAAAEVENIVWVNRTEEFLVRRALAQTSNDLRRNLLRDYVQNFSFGLYVGFASATSADQVFILFSGTDATGKRVQAWERWHAAIGLTSTLLLRAPQASRIARVLRAAPVSRRVLGTATEVEHTLIMTRRGVMAVPRSHLIETAPQSVKAAQMERIPLTFEPHPGAAAASPDCAPGPRPRRSAVDRLRNSVLDDQDIVDLVNEQHFDNAAMVDYVQRRYGNNARIVGLDSDPVFSPQSFDQPSCNLMSTLYLIDKRTGKKIGEIEGRRMMIRNNLLGSDADDPLGVFVDEGVAGGYRTARVRGLAELHGAEAVTNVPAMNGRVNLGYIDSLLRQDMDVHLVVDFGQGAGQHVRHAVVVEDIGRGANGFISEVTIFDPVVGRRITMPAADFDPLIARNAANYGILTVYRWGSAP